MTQRERSMLLVVIPVGAFAVLVGGFMGVTNLWGGLDQKQNDIARLEKDTQLQEASLMRLAGQQRKLGQWRKLSLPSEPATAVNRYRAFLGELTARHQLKLMGPITDSGPRTASAQRSAFTPHSFKLSVETTMPHLVTFLKEFYSVRLPHQIRDFRITAQGTDLRVAGAQGSRLSIDAPSSRLTVDLTIEALSIAGAPARESLFVPDTQLVALDVISALKQGPPGLGLLPLGPMGVPYRSPEDTKLASSKVPGRGYSRMAYKNAFVGLAAPPPRKELHPNENALKFVRLVSIVGTDNGYEAELYNQQVQFNRSMVLRNDGGGSYFEVRDRNNFVIFRGRVRTIDRRDVVISFERNNETVNCVLHIGESLQEATERDPDKNKELLKPFEEKVVLEEGR